MADQETVTTEETKTATRGKGKTQQVENAAPVSVDENELIPVYNNTFGKMVFNSPRDNNVYIWHEYNEMDYLKLHELRLMKNNYPRYFKDGWVRIEHEGAIKHLRLNKNNYMKDAMAPDELEELFDMDLHIDEFEDIVKGASNSNKQLIAGMAREKIANGEFDTRRKIQILEEVLNIDLSE